MDKSLLATAVVGSSFGIKGHNKLSLFSGSYSHLKKLDKVLLVKGKREITKEIEEIKKSGKDVLIKFKDIETLEKAKSLAGFTIYVKREDAAKLEKGEIYLSDLIGCFVTVNNEKVGEIISYFEGPQAPLLEVKLSDKKVLIPYLKRYVGEADFINNTIELLEKDLLL